MTLPLFDYVDPDGCDHLPVWDRKWTDTHLVCHKCGKKLKRK